MIIDKDFGKLILQTANIDKDAGNLNDASKYMEQASEISLKLSNVFHPTYLYTLRQLGAIHKDLGSLTKAHEYLELHHKYTENDYAKTPLNPDPLKSYWMAISCFELGEINQIFGRFTIAIDFYQKARFLFEELYENNFNGHPILLYYSGSLERLGYFYFQNGIYTTGLNLLEQSSKLKKKNLLENPNDIDFKASLSTIFDKQGDISLALGDYNKALNYFNKFLNFNIELIKIEPHSLIFKNHLSIGYSKIGRIYREQGRFSMALASFNNSLENRKLIFNQSPVSEISICFNPNYASIN